MSIYKPFPGTGPIGKNPALDSQRRSGRCKEELMADLFTATRNWVRIVILQGDFPLYYSVWQKLFTWTGMRQGLAERKFLKRNKHRINVISIALCGVSLYGNSHEPGRIAENIRWIREALATDPAFFRDHATDHSVKQTLDYLGKHNGKAKKQADAGHCAACGKAIRDDPIAPLVQSSARFSDHLVYDCKACGAVFCLDCMAEMKRNQRACPACGSASGW